MSRHTARENLFKLIYERCVNGEKNALTFNMLYESEDKEQREYFMSVYNGVDERFDALNGLVAKYAAGFRIERVYKVDLAILLLASYEILYCGDIPDAAAINEAVELAKTYSTEKSAAFINGVLASVKSNKETILQNESDGADIT